MDRPTPQDLYALFRHISRSASALPATQRLGYYQGALDQIPNPVDRQSVESLLLAAGVATPPAMPRQIVLLVHGIQSRGVWQEPLATLLNSIPNVTATPVRFGFVDVIRLLVPGPLRRNPISHLIDQIQLVRKDNKDARISVIAHSYGTYAITEALLAKSYITLYRLILCGSIVRPRFPMDRIATQLEMPPVLNECGTRDVWPVWARSLTWGYGASGTFGFENVSPINRFWDLNHAGFFTEEFYRSAWLPLFDESETAPRLPPGQRPTSPMWYTLVDQIPLRWLVVLLFGALLLGLVSLIRRI